MFSLRVLLKKLVFAAGFAPKMRFYVCFSTFLGVRQLKGSPTGFARNGPGSSPGSHFGLFPGWGQKKRVFAAGFAQKLGFRCRFCSKSRFSLQFLFPKCVFTCVFPRFWGLPGLRDPGPVMVKTLFPGAGGKEGWGVTVLPIHKQQTG